MNFKFAFEGVLYWIDFRWEALWIAVHEATDLKISSTKIDLNRNNKNI